MATRLDDVRSLLEEERDELTARLEIVNAALASLGNGSPAATPAPKRTESKPKSRRRASSRKSKWTKAELTCPDPDCDFVATAPQGLAGHVRTKHPDLQASTKAES